MAVAADGSKQLGLQHTRTLRMADDVLAVRVSPDGRLLAIALLDSTVKVQPFPTISHSSSYDIVWLSWSP